MKNLIVAIPHSHTWFWTQTCLASLQRNPPKAEGYEVNVVVVDNSPWSPAIRGVTDTVLGKDALVIPNHKTNKFHASALDCVVEDYDFSLLMALETDVLALSTDWLQWFVDQMTMTDYAVGMWHHEQFVNPSCTLYKGGVLRDMMNWCKSNKEPGTLRWGPSFGKSQPVSERQPERDYKDWYGHEVDWIAGPFAEKRGWPVGTVLKEQPSGQNKGPGWYEPGQALHHWAVDAGFTYTICPSDTTVVGDVPVQSLYGSRWMDSILSHLDLQLEPNELFGVDKAVHLWGGTRALDIIKHEVTCQFVKRCTPGWLAREARFWKQVVPAEVQLQTIQMIREYGWHITGQGTDHVTQRDKDAAEYVRSCYREGGVEW